MAATVTDISTARARAYLKWHRPHVPQLVRFHDGRVATLLSAEECEHGIMLYEIIAANEHKSYFYLGDEFNFLEPK